jgi:methylthioribose-1-phosphate isomerase
MDIEMTPTIEWTGECVRLLDQTQLPARTVFVDITDHQQMWDAIKRLVVRGAPAIGVSAAFGAYLGVRNFGGDARALLLKLSEVCDYLATSRPTAVNLFWALKRIQRIALEAGDDDGDPKTIKQRILDEAIAMLAEDCATCKAIGEHGVSLLERAATGSSVVNVLTHCNAGSLCAVQYGTALAPIYVGAQRGVRFHVFADETRPLLQGSRITAYELQQSGVPVTVLCDNMAAQVMGSQQIHAVIVGADRIAANGDVANKIGTLGVAILAKHFNIPFYVAAPISTIDYDLRTGAQIPIEHRAAEEVSNGFGQPTAPKGVDIYNPAFDVTPHDLVSAIITERGVATAPYEPSLEAIRSKG